jgi:hypothetical protein
MTRKDYFDGDRYTRIRQRIERIWQLVRPIDEAEPAKLPARRRRRDREIPRKAA